MDYSLDAAISALPLPLPFCSIRIQYSGTHGSVIAQISSVDARQDLVVDARAVNEGDAWTGSGANPWHLDDQTESFLFLTDESQKPARIGFVVAANGMRYDLMGLLLAPHETRMIDLRKLRDAQIPDPDGHKIPASATDGSVNWTRLDNVPVAGRLVVIRRRGGVSSNYDCTPCQCNPAFLSLSISPSSATILVGATTNFGDTATYEDCNGYFYRYPEAPASGWNSSNASVATASGGTVTGQGGGTATISATYGDCAKWKYDYFSDSCSCSLEGNSTANGSATVQVPTSLSIVPGTSITSSESSCTTGGQAACGVTRTFKYQVNDQNGLPIRIAGMPFGDIICNTSTNQLNLQSYTTTCGGTSGSCWGSYGPCRQTTDANGQFTETLSVCAPTCKKSGTCTTAGQTVANQSWTVAGTALDFDVKSISYQCNKILVNGN